MTRYQQYVAMALAVVLVTSVGVLIHAQAANDVPRLRTELGARYDIVALQDGIALVPRERNASVRLIEIRDGAIVIDGSAVTARELRDKIGRDYYAILRVTYLDAAGQRQLAGATAPGSSASSTATAQIQIREADRPVSALPPPIERQTKKQGDVVRIGGNVTVPRDQSVMGDVVAVFGSADVDGEVSGDVTVVMGSLTLGSDAVVRGDVTVVGGALHRAAGAQIEGSINEVGRGEAGRWQHWHGPASMFGSFVQRVGSLMGTLLRVTLLMFVTFIVVAAGRHTTERIAEHVGADPVRSGLAGLLAEVMFVPLLVVTIVVLAVSIVGSPLLVLVPFGVVLFFLVLVVGFAGVAYRIGGALMQRFGWRDRGPYAAVAVGVIAITAVTITARLAGLAGGFLIGAPISAVGYLIEYAAWTVGLGASILTWLNTRQRRASAGGNFPSPSIPTAAPESGT